MDASQSQFLKNYLKGDDVSGFLKTEPSAEWQRRLGYFDSYAASIGAQAKAAGVPFVVVLLPARAQVYMLSTGDWPLHYDPYALDRELRRIVVSHGGSYIDILGEFRNMTDIDQMYQPGDEHASDEGHALLARLIEDQLTNGAVPSLTASANRKTSQERST
jgi:hypothetical protein